MPSSTHFPISNVFNLPQRYTHLHTPTGHLPQVVGAPQVTCLPQVRMGGAQWSRDWFAWSSAPFPPPPFPGAEGLLPAT